MIDLIRVRSPLALRGLLNLITNSQSDLSKRIGFLRLMQQLTPRQGAQVAILSLNVVWAGT